MATRVDFPESIPTFYRKIYVLTAQIPAGQVATYSQLAFLAGSPRASRIAGCAMACGPDFPATACFIGTAVSVPRTYSAGTGFSGSCWSRKASPFSRTAVWICVNASGTVPSLLTKEAPYAHHV